MGPVRDDMKCPRDVFNARAPGLDGPRLRALGPGCASGLQRAFDAAWFPGGAHCGSQFHHGLVEIPGPERIEHRRGTCRDPAQSLRSIDGQVAAEESCHDPLDIAIDRRDRLLEANRGHGRCSVRPYARQCAQISGRGRKPTAPGVTHRESRPMQVPGSCVVTEALPHFEHIFERRVGQIHHGRPPVHEPLPVAGALIHPGLLQDDFAEPNRIRVRVCTPGQRPLMPVEPRQQSRGRRL